MVITAASVKKSYEILIILSKLCQEVHFSVVAFCVCMYIKHVWKDLILYSFFPMVTITILKSSQK